jgi:integrase
MKRGNGEGSVFKLGGTRRNPWAVRITLGWTPEGKQKLKYLGYYRTKTEAKEALRNYHANPYDLEKKDTTLHEVYGEWLKITKISESTLRTYKSAYNRCAVLHGKAIREIKVAEIELVMAEMPPSSQPVLKNVLKNVFEYAEKNEIITKNIIGLVKVEKHTAKKKKTPLTREQIKAVMAYDGHHHADTAKILLYTGMRITELFDIKLENVNLEERYMIGGKKTEEGTERTIPFHDDIFPIVERLYNTNRQYLVESVRGRQVVYQSFLEQFWRKYQKELGITQTPHDFRHTLVTFATKQGVDRAALQKIVGHKGADITDRYTHRTPAELREELNKLKF